MQYYDAIDTSHVNESGTSSRIASGNAANDDALRASCEAVAVQTEKIITQFSHPLSV